jgi:hypothetical protein
VGAAAVLAIGASTMVVVSPAEARDCRKGSYKTDWGQFAYDNCPGNHAKSWSWVLNDDKSGFRWTKSQICVQFPDKSVKCLTTGAGYSSRSASWRKGPIQHAWVCLLWSYFDLGWKPIKEESWF